MRIAVDVMGGDGGPGITVPASLRALEQFSDLSLFLVGNRQFIEPLLPAASDPLRQRIKVVHGSQCISDEDKPGNVLRNARQSSMYLAVGLVKSGAVEATVSAGNTGALLMIGRHLLKTIPGVHKPAIMATLPGANRCHLLDVGANPECDAAQLFEFAVMGSVLAESLDDAAPRVGLLNIGVEEYKGTEAVRDAAALLDDCPALNYIGFVEANDLFRDVADVVVCDGFVGNVTIKASAGVANVINESLAEGRCEGSSLHDREQPQAAELLEHINPQRCNGASLLGLQGSIVKSHGNATVEGFTCAIEQAVREAENRVPELIGARVAAIIGTSQAMTG